MADVLTQAAVETVAELLHVDPDRIDYLERFSTETVLEVGRLASDSIFDDLATVFRRVSKLAPLVPNAMVASAAQSMVPPLLSGRAAGALGIDHPERIKGVLSRVKPEYMADCAPYLDPRAVAVLAPIVPADLLIPGAKVLLERREYRAASRFLEHATPELVVAFAQGLDDDEGILFTAALTPNSTRLSEIVRALPPGRMNSIFLACIGDEDRLRTGLVTLARLDSDLRQRFAPVFVEAQDEVQLRELVEVARRNDILDEMHLVTDALPPNTPGIDVLLQAR